VLHDSVVSLVLASPLLPAIWAATVPAARRYVTGWVGRREIHTLAPRVLQARASGLSESATMLRLSPVTLYTRRVVIDCNRRLRDLAPPLRLAAELRWAWLIEGTSRWFSGESAHARPAIARRLREGARPAFPPRLPDAPLLGATVIDLLVREEGEAAAVRLASRLDPAGPRSALERAFRGRRLVHTEGTWRAHLARLAEAR
jgi:hypothetical protein